MNERARGRLSALSSICLIHLHGMPHERAVFENSEPGAGGGGGAGGAAGGSGGSGGSGGAGGGTDEKPTLTQTQVNSLLANERGKLEKKLADSAKAQEELAKKFADLEAQATKEREERELAGKNEAEKARINADRAAKKIQDEKDAADKAKATAETERDAARNELRNERIGLQASTALLAAKALATAIEDALPAFLAAVEIETDEKHKITAVRFGGVTQPTLAKAAEEWLKVKPHFAAAPPGGTGSKTPGGGGRPNSHERTVNELFSDGINELNQTR